MKTVTLVVVALSFVGSLSAEPPKQSMGKISFTRDVRPILQQQCYGCHQPAKTNGVYVLTDYKSLRTPGETGKPSIVPGKPDQSYLIEEIKITAGKAEMPKNREPLKPAEIELIEKWILEGAADDSPTISSAPEVTADHPPVYVAPPVVTSLAYSPDGSILAVTGYHEVILHDGEGKTILGRLVGLSERVQSVAFSPNGKSLAVAAGNPGRSGEVQIWDVAKRNLRLSIPAGFDTIYGVSWSPDGTMVAFGASDNIVRAVDATTGKQMLFMGTHSDWIFGTVFSSDGKHLVSVSRDMSMKLTEVPTQRFVDNVTSITPGALKGGIMAVDLRPMKEKKPAKVPDDTPGAKAEVYDELVCAGSDGKPRLYKMHREAKRVIGDDLNRIREYPVMAGRISSVRIDREGKRFVAAASLDGRGMVRIYDIETAKFVEAEAGTNPAPVYVAVFHPSGKSIVAAGFDGKLRFHDAETGKRLREVSAVPLSGK